MENAGKVTNLVVLNMQEGSSHHVEIRLKKLREKFQFTQEAIATKLGITRKTYRLYENGGAMPNFEIILQLSDLYKVPLDDFISKDGCRVKTPSKAILKLNKLMEGLSPKNQVALYLRASGWVEGNEDKELLGEL